MANGYSESQYRENNLPAELTVSSSDLTNKNIELSVNADWTNITKSSPMTPSSGGVIDDTAQNTSTGKASGTGVKLTVPPNALGNVLRAWFSNSPYPASDATPATIPRRRFRAAG